MLDSSTLIGYTGKLPRQINDSGVDNKSADYKADEDYLLI